MGNTQDYKKFDEILTRKVNEFYHDLTCEQYDQSHPEIMKQEAQRLKKIAKKYFLRTSGRTILDLGTGTGFVPLNLRDYLNKNDQFICTDVSNKILSKAKVNIESAGIAGHFQFIQNSGYKLPLADLSVDIAILNSVLHHLNQYPRYLNEINRILKPGGLLIISHEPNQKFINNNFLIKQFRILDKISKIKKIPDRFFLGKFYKSKNHDLQRKINMKLKESGVTKKKLSYEQILRIVDIRDRDGFIPEEIMPSYKVLKLITFDHLHWIIKRNPNHFIYKKYNHWLAKKYPKDGATFTLIMEKTD